ncbi:MAG TPA: hypothetical protein VLX28_03320 [Thermoanaerobaculia bacterium]|nr:hypothetical protein [Thermoanaerobaculia bacterium]
MKLTEFSSWLSIVQASINILALMLGGAWAYRKYVVRREREPRAEVKIDLEFVGKQGKYWLVEASAYVENKGFVRYTIRNMRIRFRYLTESDNLEEGGEEIRHQIIFPNSTDASNGKRYMEKETYVNPNLTYRYSYVTRIPQEAIFLLVHCKLQYWKTVSTAQKVFRVPNDDTSRSGGALDPGMQRRVRKGAAIVAVAEKEAEADRRTHASTGRPASPSAR